MTPLTATLFGGILTCAIGGIFIWFFLPEKKEEPPYRKPTDQHTVDGA